MTSYYCTGCWLRDNGMSNPPMHAHRIGCFERHAILGERLADELVARGPHDCVWKDCKQGGVYRPPRSDGQERP